MNLKIEKAVTILLISTMLFSPLLLLTPKAHAQATQILFIPPIVDVTGNSQTVTVACVVDDVAVVPVERHRQFVVVRGEAGDRSDVLPQEGTLSLPQEDHARHPRVHAVVVVTPRDYDEPAVSVHVAGEEVAEVPVGLSA